MREVEHLVWVCTYSRGCQVSCSITEAARGKGSGEGARQARYQVLFVWNCMHY